MTIRLDFHKYTKDEPWRVKCAEYNIKTKSDITGVRDAFRQLVALGLTGKVIVYRDSKPSLLCSDIVEAAKWTIRENENVGPIEVRWVPLPEGAFRLRGAGTGCVEEADSSEGSADC